MIPREALIKATEGGWKPDWSYVGHENVIDGILAVEGDMALVALTNAFWQALGKSLGWSEKNYKTTEWHYQAMRFYDLILNNQPTDEFWEEILSAKQTV